jgi:superfamily II DNA or RNA helicase
MMFINESTLARPTWQAFERLIYRLLMQEGYVGVRLVGRSHDGGADIIAGIGGKRWLFQAKNWKRKVGHEVLKETMSAVKAYRADVPVLVALNGFEEGIYTTQHVYLSEGIPLQLWDRAKLLNRARRLDPRTLVERNPARYEGRGYQEDAIQTVVKAYHDGHVKKLLVVMATGLGKTFVAAEALRRISTAKPLSLLVLAHTNELVYQLERAFWPFLQPTQGTVVWNGVERPDPEDVRQASVRFACIDTVAGAVDRGLELPVSDVVVVDECHHAASPTFVKTLDALNAGSDTGPFLLGLTATPWRGDGIEVEKAFGPAAVAIDLITGMRQGFLTNVDYRVYTSNIDWHKLAGLKGKQFTPKAINRALFISEWDDSVVLALQEVWGEHRNPRAIVFCGTIDHAIQMRDRVNALGFCNAAAIFSGIGAGQSMKPWERNRILADFDEGKLGVVCAVDIFNEGIDVPDVNILVFQRVTHSRRIFIQQLGRGLRLSPEKDKVIVLDFVSDVRRFAADIDLKDQLAAFERGEPSRRGMRVRLNNRVSFRRVGGEDPEAESFLRQWLEDVTAIEAAGEDARILKFPPAIPDRVQ